VSSIRLYILGALEIEGDMHGHQLRQLAEKEHIDQWADVTVGGLYGAIKRLASEGLIAEVRVEREGSYPERQVWTITDAGRSALGSLRLEGLTEVVIKPDPFDLAMSRFDLDRSDMLADVLSTRIATLRELVAESESHRVTADPYLSLGEKHIMRHKTDRLLADIAWHEDLLALLPDIITDEQSRKDSRS
jgi:DNA-binding PadR family transcriptional regulator